MNHSKSILDFLPRAKLALCIFVMFGLLSGCDKALPTLENAAPSPSNDYALSDSELISTTISAEKGDIDAMLRLADYYLIYKDGPDDEKTGLFWVERAANAGHLDTREFLLGHYAADISPEKRQHGQAIKDKWDQGTEEIRNEK
jgi:hypothetical protein